MKKMKKVTLWLLLLFRIMLALAVGLAIFEQSWLILLMAALTLLLTFVPDIIRKRFQVSYPTVFELLILVFIFASLYLGELQFFYYRFWWWDLMLHTIAGIIAAFLGFSLLYILHTETKILLRMSPLFMALFTFSFAVTLGALWEVFEFLMDTFFGFNMQKSGLPDTMSDLIVDVIGAFMISVIGYFYVKSDRGTLRKIKKLFHA